MSANSSQINKYFIGKVSIIMLTPPTIMTVKVIHLILISLELKMQVYIVIMYAWITISYCNSHSILVMSFFCWLVSCSMSHYLSPLNQSEGSGGWTLHPSQFKDACMPIPPCQYLGASLVCYGQYNCIAVVGLCNDLAPSAVIFFPSIILGIVENMPTWRELCLTILA